MSSPSTKTWDELLQELTPSARATAAQARNAKIRLQRARAEVTEASAVMRRHMRTLHHRHGLTPNKIATLLDYSRNVVVEYLERKR